MKVYTSWFFGWISGTSLNSDCEVSTKWIVDGICFFLKESEYCFNSIYRWRNGWIMRTLYKQEISRHVVYLYVRLMHYVTSMLVIDTAYTAIPAYECTHEAQYIYLSLNFFIT